MKILKKLRTFLIDAPKGYCYIDGKKIHLRTLKNGWVDIEKQVADKEALILDNNNGTFTYIDSDEEILIK